MFRVLGELITRSSKKHGDDGSFDYVHTAISFREKRYLPVKGILPKEFLEFLKVYYGILLSNNRFFRDNQCPSSLALGGDPGLDAVLEWIRPKISRLVGLELTPTYSYTRLYAKGEVLARHKDRPACEISVTLSIHIPKGMGPSVIYLKPPNLEEINVEMHEGDGCLYAGTEVEHWREAFRADGYIQLFLHFIARHGRNFPTYAYDQRERLGAPRVEVAVQYPANAVAETEHAKIYSPDASQTDLEMPSTIKGDAR